MFALRLQDGDLRDGAVCRTSDVWNFDSWLNWFSATPVNAFRVWFACMCHKRVVQCYSFETVNSWRYHLKEPSNSWYGLTADHYSPSHFFVSGNKQSLVITSSNIPGPCWVVSLRLTSSANHPFLTQLPFHAGRRLCPQSAALDISHCVSSSEYGWCNLVDRKPKVIVLDGCRKCSLLLDLSRYP